MSNYNNKLLLSTTAILSALIATSSINISSANAGTITEETFVDYVMADGEDLTITTAGGISGDSVLIDGAITAGDIINEGTLQGSGVANIHVTNGSTLGSITNSGDNIDGGSAVRVDTGSTISGDITNSGTMNGGSASLYIIGASHMVGDITNSGTMGTLGNMASIALAGGSTITGTITNTGTMNGSRSGLIDLYDAGTNVIGSIVNEGSVNANTAYIYMNNSATMEADVTNTASGTMTSNDYGFFLANSATISGDITNNGVMTAGINVIFVATGNDLGISGNITNNGTMTATSDDTFDLSWGEISGTITNTGTIQSVRNAFFVQGNSDISGGIINETTGIIKSTGTTTSTAAIYISAGDISGGVVNKGQIIGNTGQTAALYLNSLGSNNPKSIFDAGYTADDVFYGVTNTGTIDANGATNAIYMSASRVPLPININGGRVIGDVTDNTPGFGFENSVREELGHSPVTIGGQFTTEGDFTVSSFTVTSGGELTVDDGRTLTTATLDINDNPLSITTFFNDGSINIEDNAAVTIATTSLQNNSTINIGKGAMLNASALSGAGTYSISIVDDGSDTLDSADFGSITISSADTTVDLSDDTFHFNVEGEVAIGANVLIVDGNVNTSGVPNITDNSIKYKFSLTASGNDLLLTTEESVGIEVAAGDSESQGAVDALQDMFDNLSSFDSDLESVLNAAMDAADSDALDEVVNKMRRPVDGSTVAGGLAVSRKSANMAMSRLSSVRAGDADVASADSFSLDGGESGIAAGNPYFFTPSSRNKHAWAQAFGQIGKQSERNGFEGYDSHTYGMMFGVDSKEIIDDATIGVAVSYGRTDVDSDSSNNTQVETNTYQISLYGEKLLEDDVRLDGIVGYAFSNSDMDIYDIGGVSGVDASGEFDGQQFSAQATLSKDIATEHGFKLTPSISANYIYSDTDQYTDTGAGGASATVDNEAMELFEIGLGIEASAVYQISPCECGTDWLKPVLRAGVRHDFIGDAMESTTQFVGGGSSFKTYGFSPAKTTYNVGAGFKRYSLEDWEATAMYDLEFKQDYYSHNASFRLGRRF